MKLARYAFVGAILSSLALTSLGLVMLASIGPFVRGNGGNPHYFLARQSIWFGLGLVVWLIFSRVDYHFWIKHAWWWLGGSLILQVLCFVPVIGGKINGSYRWLQLGPLNLQPGEALKIAIVLVLVLCLGRGLAKVHTWKHGVAIPMAVVAVPVSILLLAGDLGTAVTIFVVVSLMLVAVGVRLVYLFPIWVGAMAALVFATWLLPGRMIRIWAFLDPSAHSDGAAYQIEQGLIALGSGGPGGLGLFQGVQKVYYVPEAHTDFIFTIVGEELGMFGTLGVVMAFTIITLSGILIATHASDGHGYAVSVGVTGLIALQAALNMAVVTRMVPATGLGLPFVSYGGSNLLLMSACVGLLCSVHRQAQYEPARRLEGLYDRVIWGG